MKPMSPEDLEMEREGAEVARLYRASAQALPPQRLDDAILSAARQTTHKPSRSWQVPLSAAAMLIIGVSLVFLMRENEPPEPEDRGQRTEDRRDAKALLPPEASVTVAELARPAAPALKAESGQSMGEMNAPVPQRPLAKNQESGTPGEFQGARGNAAPVLKKGVRREFEQGVASSGVRQSEPSAAHASKAPVDVLEEAKWSKSSVVADSATVPRKEMPASEPPAMPHAKSVAAAPATSEVIEIEKRAGDRADQRVNTLADADLSKGADSSPAEAEKRKRASLAPVSGTSQMSAEKSVAAPSLQALVASDSPGREIAAIEQLLREGKTSLARTRVSEFVRRHPDYVLPPRLKALLPAQTPDQ
ncbi:MAG: hypothetical protein ABL878_06150 [Burkholderiales bacterium]